MLIAYAVMCSLNYVRSYGFVEFMLWFGSMVIGIKLCMHPKWLKSVFVAMLSQIILIGLLLAIVSIVPKFTVYLNNQSVKLGK